MADRDFLLQALAALPQRQRAVLVLRYFCDLRCVSFDIWTGGRGRPVRVAFPVGRVSCAPG